MEKIALIGAAGAIGQSISYALNKKGQEYRVVGRNRGSLEATFGGSELAEIATWNPDDPDSARAAVRGVDTLGCATFLWELKRQALSGKPSNPQTCC